MDVVANTIKTGKDPPFVDEGYDPLDGFPLTFRWKICRHQIASM